jgi:hypothetical protein
MKNCLLRLRRGYFTDNSGTAKFYVITDFEKYLEYCQRKYVVSLKKNFPLELGWYDVFPGIKEPPPYDFLILRKVDIFLKIGERKFELESMPKHNMYRVLCNGIIFWGYSSYFERIKNVIDDSGSI